MLTPNQVLRSRYRIIRQLGESETGRVYKAHDSVRETNVALKEILIDLDKVPSITQREILKRGFANQAKILAKVKHESLPQLRGFFSEIDRHYLVMELVEGTEASELLAKDKSSLPVSDVIIWADQLLDALDYLHTSAPPIIHGDVKPQNVMLTSRGKIKLLGFDIAEETNSATGMSAANQTSVAATLRYAPLEQILRAVDLAAQEVITKSYSEKLEKILNQPVDARSDIYSLGATLYHIVTAEAPNDALERMLSVWSGKPDPLSTPNEIDQNVPYEISDVLMKALEIECEKRFGSATEMLQALQKAAEQARKREAEEAKEKEEESVREIRLAEQKRLEQERELIETERLRLETEQKRQSELIAEQLKLAETERIKAEQRAAEAEQRLLEKETEKADDREPLAASAKFSKDSTKVSKSVDIVLEPINQKDASNELKGIFAEAQTDNKSSRMIPIAAVICLLIGGAVAGIWFLRSSNAAQSNQPTSNQTASSVENATSEPKIEPTPQPSIEKISETTEISEPSLAPILNEKQINQPAVKNKAYTPPMTIAPQPRVGKPIPPPTKPAANQKKAVTVDDLINGN